MNIVLYDLPDIRTNLLPISYTRPIAKILVGLRRIEEKWAHFYGEATFSYATTNYLQLKFPTTIADENLVINSAICPNAALIDAINALQPDEVLMQDNLFIAAMIGSHQLKDYSISDAIEGIGRQVIYTNDLTVIDAPWKIFAYNAQQIKSDFEKITSGRTSNPVEDQHTIIYNEENVFIEPGVSIKAAIINAEEGPVYIGKGCNIHEGAAIKGPFGVLENSNINMGAKIRGGTTVGPYCKVGGEVNNAVVFGYSNKGHDGFLGNAVIGEWCNLGADTNNSNLKNNYSIVRLWNYATDGFKSTGLQFCGLIMGDHSKCGINTMFNTGTVVGVSANIFGGGYLKNFVPSFSWGGAENTATYKLEKALEVATMVMKRREIVLSEEDKNILKHVFSISEVYRGWEKNNVKIEG